MTKVANIFGLVRQLLLRSNMTGICKRQPCVDWTVLNGHKFKFRHYRRLILNSILLCSIPGLKWSQKNEIKCEAKTVSLNVTADPVVVQSIIKLINDAKSEILKEHFKEAKQLLHTALDIAEKNKIYDNVSEIFDFLAVLAMQEGTVLEVEDLLVRFIEKLIEIGYPENDDSIVRYKLKLSKLYHMMGNTEMAELGFRNCISTQEKKIFKKKVEDGTYHLYVSSLFWYGRFLTEEEELDKARFYMQKTLKHARSLNTLSTAQMMVILFHNAEVSFKLKEYDNSIDYLVEAINLCMDTNTINDDLPIFIVKLGIVFLYKGIYDKARFWCENGQQFAKMLNNPVSEKESELCLERLDELEKRSALRTKK